MFRKLPPMKPHFVLFRLCCSWRRTCQNSSKSERKGKGESTVCHESYFGRSLRPTPFEPNNTDCYSCTNMGSLQPFHVPRYLPWGMQLVTLVRKLQYNSAGNSLPTNQSQCSINVTPSCMGRDFVVHPSQL